MFTRLNTTRKVRTAILAAGALVLATLPLATQGAAQEQDPAQQDDITPNPVMEEACGVDVTLVLDASGSISDAGAIENVRTAGGVFLDALADTDSRARVIDFSSFGRETAALAEVTTASIAAGGVHRQAMVDYYNPQPPRQPGVRSFAYGGGPIDAEASYTEDPDPADRRFTNWDQALDLSNDTPDDLIVFVTDGTPTAGDLDKAGDPFYVAGQDPPNVRFAVGLPPTATLGRPTEEANEAKGNGTRILAVGVGTAFTNTDAVDRLKEISGPQVADGTVPVESINDVDVALVSDFDVLAAALRQIVTELCANSLTIRKLAQSPTSQEYLPAEGWDMTVDPGVGTSADPPYSWVLPDGAPVGPATVGTDAEGFSSFQWEPDPVDAVSTATVTETLQDGYAPRDWVCESRDPGEQPVGTTGTLTAEDPSFEVAVGPKSTVTCTIRNDYVPEPDLTLDKTADATEVPPETEVTYTFTATNTGKTTLLPQPDRDGFVVDDHCTPAYVGGDDADDSEMAPGEVWTYTCSATIAADTTNIAMATALDKGTEEELVREDTWTVEVTETTTTTTTTSTTTTTTTTTAPPTTAPPTTAPPTTAPTTAPPTTAPPSGDLPFSGSNTAPLLLSGLALLFVGLLSTAAQRRMFRRSARTD